MSVEILSVEHVVTLFHFLGVEIDKITQSGSGEKVMYYAHRHIDSYAVYHGANEWSLGLEISSKLGKLLNGVHDRNGRSDAHGGRYCLVGFTVNQQKAQEALAHYEAIVNGKESFTDGEKAIVAIARASSE